jgi:hypothetical protein
MVFLNEGEGETHISMLVAEQLSRLCDALAAGDMVAVNAHLLHISTHHWAGRCRLKPVDPVDPRVKSTWYQRL